MKKYTWQAKLGISLLLLFSLLSGLRSAKEASIFKPFLIGNDAPTIFVDRFAGLKNELNPGETVGYLSDTPPEQSGLWVTDYYLTQYALTPILVDNNENHPFIVGNFHNPDYKINITADKKLYELKDFGNGVFLFSREEK